MKCVLLMMLLFQVRVQYEIYPKQSEQSSRLAFLIHDLEVRDRLTVSSINKLLYQYTSDDIPKQTHADLVSALNLDELTLPFL